MNDPGDRAAKAGDQKSARREAPFSPAAPPPLNLPKSGGALRAIGEKFTAGGPTGTGSMRVPLPVSPGRDGIQPALALSYDSGQGHGPFGIGWALDLPAITRRTDKGIPRYEDANESDIFVLSGQEDLVPELAADRNGWSKVSSTDGEYRVDAYRPRVEGLFARVERRTHLVTGDTHWRSITSDNVTSVFGLSPAARIADPSNPLHVFKWLLEATFDDRGHATLYEYKAEDLAGVSPSDLAEASRWAHPPANVYPKRVHYGNATPLTNRNPALSDLTGLTWFFEMVFDYGEHTTDLPDEASAWAVRPDPYSTYRSGFEIRTYRLCQRVLMFHRMPQRLGAAARLVKATELTYDAGPAVTYLTRVRNVGYAWDPSGVITKAYTPTLRLDYTRVKALSTTVEIVDETALAQLPAGIDGASYQLVDLDGEGIAGILTAPASPASALYYKRNLGSGEFAQAERLPIQPSLRSMEPDVRLLSLNADGRIDVARLSGPTPGYYERTRNFDWAPFTPFASLPKVDWKARGVHLLDVDGDGLTDVLVAEDDVFVWYPSLSRAGFGAPHRVTQAHDEDRGAVVLTTDDYETIFLADMSGDGLSDIVRIRNGSVCYWPNLGYGRFGAKVSMRSAPLFDTPDLFDPRRIRLGDVDGTGTTDIVYVGRHGAVVYLNQAGNAWSAGTVIPIPTTGTLASVRVADLLGTGTSCIVWSSSDPLDVRSPLRYVDLLRSTKPHLLTSIANGLGAETSVTYAPSTRFYLEDRAAGRPWATRLPFVVQTVARVETVDHIALTRVVSQYRYAHGWYDGIERENRGFARVDHWDAEFMSSAHGAGTPPASITESSGEYDLPPIHTVTWFHTGAWNGERDDLRRTLSQEFYAGDSLAPPLAETLVQTTLGTADLREAYRSLKGRVLRTEVYAEDGTPAAATPYVVTDHRYEVRQIQPIDGQRHGVYHPFAREELTLHYERNSSDPRAEHTFFLEIDPLGHVRREAHVAYARRTPAEPEQGVTLATCRLTEHAAPVMGPYDYRHGVPTELLGYELSLPPTSSPIALEAVDAAMTGASVLPFDGTLAAGTMRTIEHVQHIYYADDLSAALPLGSTGIRALVYDHLALALPSTLATTIFGARVAVGELVATAGYANVGGDFWTRAGVTTYDAASFYQATSFVDPFGNTSRVVYDPERLFIVEEHTSADPAFDNVTTVTMDYRVLAPALLTDPNGNRNAVAFDELGMVVKTAVMGRAGAGEGDTLDDPTTTIDYDLLAWEAATPSPTYVHTRARIQHGSTNPGWVEAYTYSDGTGHEVLRKVQAAPDPTTGATRWIGTGRTVFDNKGNPIKKYEPYFAADPNYDDELALVATGYSQILRYDPLSRLIRIDEPDGTFSTTEWDAWREVRADANDNVLESAWYADASSRPPSDPLYRAASLAAKHAHTPAIRVVDPLGRTVLSIADNGGGVTFPTRTQLDIQGNALTITDANGIVTLTQVFDARGQVLQHVSVDAGTSYAIDDVQGQPYRAWDARGFVQRKVCDALRRLTHVWITPPGGAEFLAERVVYGEGLSAPNFRGHIYLHFDGAGVLTNAAYDLEGRITQTTRQLAAAYQTTPDWSALAGALAPTAFVSAAIAAGLLETADTFETGTDYDALNRITRIVTHDKSKTLLTYDPASLVSTVTAYLRGAVSPTPIVTNVDYNARGQRTSVTSGKGVKTAYTYDDRTHMILRVLTTRPSDGARLQNLNYTYDPAHNVAQITDLAQQTVYFAGNVTSGTQLFAYDPTYRLTHAEGREQPGQVGYALGPDGYPEAPLSAIPHRNDLQALLGYTEDYSYDPVGNILATVHKAAGAGWTRAQTYVPGTNRLDRVSMPGDLPGGPYSGVHQHDAAGNLTQTPNISAMTWDHAGRLSSANLGGGGTAYFVYDGKGERVRKIVERSGLILERLYVGDYERYREHSGASLSAPSVTLERESLHIYDGHRRFALIETKTLDASVANLVPTPLQRFQFPNHLGTACVETDESGTAISYEEFYSFGGSSFRAGDVDKRYRFSGKERDEETGLYYYGARYLAPWLSRWLAVDPAGTHGGTSPYAYASCNPLGRVDPDGMQDTPAQTSAVREAELQVEIAQSLHITPSQVTELALAIGKGPISMGTLHRQLVDAGAIKAPISSSTRTTVLDEVTTPDPYNPDRVLNVARYGPAREIAQAKDIATRATAGRIAEGLALAGGAVAHALNQPSRTAGPARRETEEPATRPLPRPAPTVPEPEAEFATAPKQLPAGGPTTITREQAARFRGTPYERGQALNRHLAEIQRGKREVRVATPAGVRVHDVRVSTTSVTDLALEAKNYLRYRVVGGTPTANAVGATSQIMGQLAKDRLWIREGMKAGLHRTVQWDFAGAPPSAELAGYLQRYGISYVSR